MAHRLAANRRDAGCLADEVMMERMHTGRCFVLKDARGHSGGYLMQGMEEICCRIGEPKRNAKVVLLFEDGTEEEHSLDTGDEARWENKGRLLLGGYTCAGGRLWLATGDEARSACQKASMKRMTQSKKTENRPEEREKTGQHGDGREEDGKRTGGRREERTWPQRRWPPPPCWTDARYINGCWQEENQ